MSNEELIRCPKGCGTKLPVHLMHEHFTNCKGASQSFDQLVSQIPTWPPIDTTPQLSIPVPKPLPPPEPYKEPQRAIKDEVFKTAFCPIHGIEYIETEYYKICIKCKRPKIKPKMFWWFTLRYFLMASWLILLAGFIFGIYSYHKLYPP